MGPESTHRAAPAVTNRRPGRLQTCARSRPAASRSAGDSAVRAALGRDSDASSAPRDLGRNETQAGASRSLLTARWPSRSRRPTADRAPLLGRELPGDLTGSLQTFVSVLRRHLTPERERARSRRHRAGRRHRFATELVARSSLERFDQLPRGSAREPTRLARASLEQSAGLVRGEVFEDRAVRCLGTGLALALPGPDSRRPSGGGRGSAGRARLCGCARITPRRTAALDRFASVRTARRCCALYALDRPHERCALPQLSHAARRGARPRADRGDAGAQSGSHRRQRGRPLLLLPRRSAGRRLRPASDAFACSAACAELRRSSRQSATPSAAASR